MPTQTIIWTGDIDGYSQLIDQTLLPGEYKIIDIKDIQTMWDAIKILQVRGAPAIGIAAAYGIILGIQSVPDDANSNEFFAKLNESCDYLATSRPTAVNLFWAIERMKNIAIANKEQSTADIKAILFNEALAIHSEDAAMCRAIGDNGSGFITEGANILTHCNAGGLATADYGTALALMFSAKQKGTKFHVYADETRPLLQGARLTAWELMQEEIPVTLICDNMAGHLMKLGKIDLVITGADRITANGDAANKIGTYSVAALAHMHNIPFYIAAPSSTFDLSLATGDSIPIEERDPLEVTEPFGRRTAPANVKVFNPAFDVTPHKFIKAIITEKGIIENPNTQKVTAHFA